MGESSFWISAVGFPLAVLLITIILRAVKSNPQTSATDIFALLVLFDISAVADAPRFAAVISQTVKPLDVIQIFLLLLLISAVVWVFCLLELESRLAGSYADQYGDGVTVGTLFTVIGVWCACLALIVTHVAIFAGRISI